MSPRKFWALVAVWVLLAFEVTVLILRRSDVPRWDLVVIAGFAWWGGIAFALIFQAIFKKPVNAETKLDQKNAWDAKYLPPLHGGYKPRPDADGKYRDTPPKPPTGSGGGSHG